MMKKLVMVRQENFTSLDIKIGLDTVVVVHLITNPGLFKEQSARIFKRKGIFYIHELQLKEGREIKKVLKRDYNFSKKQADDGVNKFIKDNHLQIIKKDRNKSAIARHRHIQCINNGVYLGGLDAILISDFIDNGITKVFSEDGEFIKAAEFLGLNAERIFFNIKKTNHKEH